MVGPMRRLAVVAVAVVAVALLAAACGMDQRSKKEPTPTFSASRLGMPTTSMWETLTPDQREALRGSEMYEEFPAEEVAVEEQEGEPSTMDKVEEVSVSLLSIGVTLGAMAAPFLMF